MNQKKLIEDLKEIASSNFFQIGSEVKESHILPDAVVVELISSGVKAQLHIGDTQVAIVSADTNAVIVEEKNADLADSAVGRLICQAFSIGDGELEHLPAGLMPAAFPRKFPNSVIYPKAVVSNRVLFADHNGHEWITSGQVAPNVTLSLYNLLYDEKGDHLTLKLPGLFPKDKVKIGSSMTPGVSPSSNVMSEVEDKLIILGHSPQMINSSAVGRGSSYINRTGAVKSNSYLSDLLDRVSGNRPAKVVSADLSASIKSADELILSKNKKDLSLTFVSSGYGPQRNASTYEIEADLALLTPILSRAGYTVLDLADNCVITAADMRGSREFNSFMTDLLHVVEIKSSVAFQEPSDAALAELVYDNKKADGSATLKVFSSDKNVKKEVQMEDYLVSNGYSPALALMDKISIMVI